MKQDWRRSRAYRIWRIAVIRRDKVCVVCQSRQHRHAHHIDSASILPRTKVQHLQRRMPMQDLPHTVSYKLQQKLQSQNNPIQLRKLYLSYQLPKNKVHHKYTPRIRTPFTFLPFIFVFCVITYTFQKPFYTYTITHGRRDLLF